MYCKNMENIVEMDEMSPTAEDNMKNRLREFLLHGLIQFNQTASTNILISMDKDNAKTSKCANYIGKIVNASVTGGAFLAGAAGPLAKGVGMVSGEIVDQLITEYDKSMQHKTSKKIETFLEGFDPEEEKWIVFILQCLTEVFLK